MGKNNCEFKNNVFDERMYVGRIQFNLNDGKKKIFIFSTDYEPKYQTNTGSEAMVHYWNGEIMKNISGVTLIEMLIGIVISSIIIAAMYTTYSVINNTYSRVTDVAGISKSEGYCLYDNEDVRMAGYKYYYGYNEANELKAEGEKIPRNDYLQFIPETQMQQKKTVMHLSLFIEIQLAIKLK